MLCMGPRSGAPDFSMELEAIKDLHTGLLASNIVQTLFSAKNTDHIPGSETNWALCLMASAIQIQASLPILCIW